MATETRPNLRVAFVVGAFPQRTETFIINQVADLMDRGVHVEVFSLEPGQDHDISSRFFEHRMSRITHYLHMPENRIARWFGGLWRLVQLLCIQPRLLRHVLPRQRRTDGLYASRLLFMMAPFAGKSFDLVHCHFGPAAKDYIKLRPYLGHRQKLVVTFYGYDASVVVRQNGPRFYADVEDAADLCFVMSHDMKRRVAAAGISEHRIVVLPVGIDVEQYPFVERRLSPGEPVQLLSVGRFVEKKGFDDIIRALALVVESSEVPFVMTFIGGGKMEAQLRMMVKDAGLEDLITFAGFMSNEEVVTALLQAHVFVQPSRTAENGDME